MMKKVIILFFSVLAAQGFLGAQNSMPVPYGSFEQWTSHPGYSSEGFFSLSVYSAYSTPTGWDYLKYPVNESYSIATVNTEIPLIVANQETASVPHGNSAVKLQTFMLSDIISSTVYSLASGSLDPTLTSTVYPSILSTGVVDIDHFIPIMESMMSDMDDVPALLASLADIDVNYVITGGIPLGGFEPARLTGYYKYHSAVSGDNGGVLVIGTHYNATLHKRDVVGGGANVNLTDCTSYTPFTVDYMSLHDYDPTYAKQDPDSLIVFIISSASMERQQGSWLCVDSLTLWEPDTCADIVILSAIPDIHEAAISWSVAGTVNGYELEYGVSGFTQGNGTTVTLNGNSHSLEGLAANTQYDVYLRTVCHDGIYGDWSMTQFQTNPDTCAGVIGLTTAPDIHEAVVSWSATGAVNGYELEYGVAGFTHGNGTSVALAGGNAYTVEGLVANTQYAVYLRSVCSEGVYGDWSVTLFQTEPDTCARILSIDIDSSSLDLTSDYQVTGYIASWQSTFVPEGWEVEYGIAGFESGTGVSATVYSPSYAFAPLQPETQYELRVRTLCTGDIYGDWESIQFQTMDTVTADTTTAIEHPVDLRLASRVSVYPNPAHGQCMVKLDGVREAELRLYTSDGSLVQSVKGCGSTVTLNLPSPGVFLLQILTPQGSLSRKIVNQ